MRLPQLLLESPYFTFTSAKELVNALGGYVSSEEKAEIDRLSSLGLPPVTSVLTCSTMLGINPGLLWSMINRPSRYYRHFQIPKGRKFRNITAPKVALKAIQKWLSFHLQNVYCPPDHVFGFVSGRSHIQAAQQHVMARWVFSVDIADFFPSTPQQVVEQALKDVGYSQQEASFIASLCCLNRRLVQGAPTSPVISNIAFQATDLQLMKLAANYGVRVTRYADDIVFSGTEEFSDNLRKDTLDLIADTQWRLAEHKTEVAFLPARLKVHGLLVHGESVRLTKGYRNKIRAYRHLCEANKLRDEDKARIRGHLQYDSQVSQNKK